MSIFRNSQRYTELLTSFDVAVQRIWPEWKTGKCVGISHEPADLERLIVTSYVLRKHIVEWLIKKRLDFTEQLKFPNLYTALGDAVKVMEEQTGPLSNEAEALERVSRAAYHWMKTYKMLGRQPTTVELQHKPVNVCAECGKEPAADDSGLLCVECSTGEVGKKKGQESLKHCYVCKSEPAVDEGLCAECGYSPPPQEMGRLCGVCNTPAVGDALFCEACGAENSSNRGVARIHSSIGPFDSMGYPLDPPPSFGSWRENNDMMFQPHRPFGKVRW